MPPARTVALAAVAAAAAVAAPLVVWQPVMQAAETGAGKTEAGDYRQPATGAAGTGAGPCGDGFYLVGDVCEPAPPGYVEARSECEMAVESMEAAGVEQDFAAEIAKCRSQGP